MNIAIIIPAYNEEITIKDTIADFHAYLPESSIYVIDNNSMDTTNIIATKMLSQNGYSGKVILEKRQGKANAIRRAFSQIEADIYIMVDADLTYPAKEIHKLLKPIIDDEYDMVVGDRQSAGDYRKENKRAFHHIGNMLVKRLINTLFESKLSDIMSGYRVFNRKFIKNYAIMSEGFEIETEMTLHALDKRFRILEIPIEYKDRPTGSSSKLNTIRDGFKVITTIFEIFKDYKPLPFFGSLSILFAILGILIGTPVIIEYFQYQYIYKVPSAILATGLMLFSLIAFTIGIILDTFVKYHRFEYELKLNSYHKRDT